MLRAVCNDLATAQVAGSAPGLVTVQGDGEIIGECQVLLVGRDPSGQRARFGLIPEAGRIGLNSLVDPTVPEAVRQGLRSALSTLPGMSVEIAAAICDWADVDDTPDEGGGAERTDGHYQGAALPYAPRNGRFETIDELRLVRGVTDELFFGEDGNGNGRLDAGEDANGNGRLDPGLRDAVTLESREPGTTSDGGPLTSIRSNAERTRLFVDLFGPERGAALGTEAQQQSPPGGYRNRLHLLALLDLSEGEIATLWPHLSGPEGRVGLVDAWSCQEAVLVALVGTDLASRIVAARPTAMPDGPAWLVQATGPADAATAGLVLTAGSYHFRADILAVARDGSGWARLDALVDCSTGFPRVIRLRAGETAGWPLPWATPARIRRSPAQNDLTTLLTADHD
jgi:hypothetical protein